MSDEPKTEEKTQETQKTKLSKKVQDLVDAITQLSVLELSELVNALQEKLGVTATPMVAQAPTTTTVPAGGEASAATSEAGAGGTATQTVVMTNAGENKIAVIKALREINQNLGLKEAKDATENVPFEVLKDAKAEDAKAAADKLKAAGATVEVK